MYECPEAPQGLVGGDFVKLSNLVSGIQSNMFVKILLAVLTIRMADLGILLSKNTGVGSYSMKYKDA